VRTAARNPPAVKIGGAAADETTVTRRPCATRRARAHAPAVAVAAMLAVALHPTAAGGTTTGAVATYRAVGPHVARADLNRLEAEMHRASRDANAAADEVFQASSRAAGLRIAIEDAADRRAQRQAALGDRVRQLYMTGRPDPMMSMFLGLSGSDLAAMAQGAQAGVRSDADLLAAVDADTAALADLQRRVDAERAVVLTRARRVYEIQDRTRRLLAQAATAYADDQAKLAEIAARRAALDAQSRDVSVAATPATTARGRRAAAAEAPIIAALEAAGSAFPPGYRATGRRLTGEASWYGPGFVGNPTATGAPYDPERFTAAMLAVPLGTVVRVTTRDGRAVNVLVNDRGPYAKHRIIDMSAAGARMLGFSGVKQVTVEVLEPLR
jgi:rare lipoprotein A